MATSTLLTIEEAARRLLRSPATLNNWRSKRRGPMYIKIEGSIAYRESDIEKYLTAREVEPEYLTVGPRQTIPMPAGRRKELPLNPRLGGHRTKGPGSAERNARLEEMKPHLRHF